MDKTLHDLHLKGIVRDKYTKEIIAAFTSCSEAIGFKNELNARAKDELYEYKESY